MHLKTVDLYLLLAPLPKQNRILRAHRAEVLVRNPKIAENLPLIVPESHL